MFGKLTPVFVVLAAWPFFAGVAQDYKAVAPKTIPQENSEPKLPDEVPSAEGSDQILLKDLKGIVFVDSMKEVKEGAVKASGVVPSSNELTREAAFKEIAEPYVGQPLSMKKLNTLVREIILYFRGEDRPVVDVVVPEQDITNAVVQIAIIEGRVGQVRAEGNKWFSNKSIEGNIRLQPGDTIRAKRLLSDIAWLNRNPFRSVDAVFAPGKDLGETDIILRTQDRFPLRPYVGYEDTGNDLTGYERWYAGFNWGNAFNLDGQLNYQFTTSSDFQGVVANSASYLQPLPWRHTVMAYVAFVQSEAEAAPFNLTGASAQAGARYNIPLLSIASYQHEIYTGFDWKQSDNQLEFGVPVTASTTDIGEWVFGYRSSLPDSWGSTSFQAEGFYNPAAWFGHQSAAEYGASRFGADPDFG